MRVVERGDVVVDGGLGFSLARSWSPVNEFRLQGGEEALGHGVVPAVANATHAADASTGASSERYASLLVLFQPDGPNRVHAVERMTQLRKRGSRGSRERRDRTAKRIVPIPHSFSIQQSAFRISL